MDRRVVLLVAAVLVGAVAGVTTAVVAPGRSEAPPGQPATINDPLRLGVPLVSLPSCSGDAVLVLGVGDSAAALSAAVNGAGGEVRYLRTDESCAALWSGEPADGAGAGGDDPDPPAYVAYLGPYDDEAEPCGVRMGDDHVRDQVVALSEQARDPVNCVCVLPSADAPVLEPPGPAEPTTDPATFTWVLTLQQMLDRLDADEGSTAAGDDPTGVYDAATVRRVRELQAAQGVPVTGTVDATTWGAVQDAACGRYTF